jgi:acyl-CoA thioesterase FadM
MNLYLRLLLLRLRNRRDRRTRRGPGIGLWDTARTPFRVVPTDLDLLRHMTNGKYLSIMDVGRIDLLTRAGFWAELTARGWYPVVAGQTITYRRSLTLGQRFDLLTRVCGFDERSVYLEQTFVVGDVVHARAVVRSRFLKRGGGQVSQQELSDLAGGFPEDRELPGWVAAWAESTRIASGETVPADERP